MYNIIKFAVPSLGILIIGCMVGFCVCGAFAQRQERIARTFFGITLGEPLSVSEDRLFLPFQFARSNQSEFGNRMFGLEFFNVENFEKEFELPCKVVKLEKEFCGTDYAMVLYSKHSNEQFMHYGNVYAVAVCFQCETINLETNMETIKSAMETKHHCKFSILHKRPDFMTSFFSVENLSISPKCCIGKSNKFLVSIFGVKGRCHNEGYVFLLINIPDLVSATLLEKKLDAQKDSELQKAGEREWRRHIFDSL